MARLKAHWPLLITILISIGYVLLRLSSVGWDPILLANPGERYSGTPVLEEEGYDGQFALYIALDPKPEVVAPHLDVPAFRYQRILLPLLGQLLGLGVREWIPWTLILINLVAHGIGTYLVLIYLKLNGVDSKYGLTYGLWVGLVAGVGLDLYEPVAFALIVGGILAWQRGEGWLSALLVSLSLFAKETSLPLWGGFLFASVFQKDQRRSTIFFVIGGVIYAIWQFWLYKTFGEFGLVSGGEGATQFEWIPFNGLWRIGAVNLRALLMFIVIFGPTILLPTIWALASSLREIVARRHDLEVWLLFSGAVLIVFLPFSTFREPLALVRLATGLILATLLFAAKYKKERVLNYSLFWCSFLVLLNPG